MEPFLQNHQYNRIAQQANLLLSALKTCTDRKVVEAARHSAVGKAVEACPGLSGERLHLVERMGDLQTNEQFQAYLSELSNYTIKFPAITERQLQRLFPKAKKLRMPELAGIERRTLTYLGWTDPGTNKQFLVYWRQPQHREDPSDSLVGVEGRYTPTNKKGLCAFCKKYGETGLFSAVTKSRLSHLPDYYKAVGQYICLDSEACNARITDLDAIETFFEAVTS
jgi:hypothetical protein